MLTISLCGKLHLTWGEHSLDESDLGGNQLRLVLAYLVLSRHGPTDRQQIAELLWGGEDLASSWESAVRRVVSRVRGALRQGGVDGAIDVASAFGCYRIERLVDTTVDVEQAAAEVTRAGALVTQGDPRPASLAARSALDVVRRPFLAGIEGIWVEERRSELVSLRLRALELEATAMIALGQTAECIVAANEALELNPRSETPYRLLMAAHRASGNKAEGLAAYERCRYRLAEDLGVYPSKETESLYLSLLGTDHGGDPAPATSDHARSPVGDPRGTAVKAAGPTPDPTIAEHRVGRVLPRALIDAAAGPFVGRQCYLAAIDEAWQAALSGYPALWLIEGEAGIGKTRLLAEVARRAAASGATVLFGRCQEHAAIPYAPFAEALSTFAELHAVDELTRLLGPYGRELAQVAPALAARIPALYQPHQVVGHEADPDARRAWMVSALDGFIASLGSSGPLLVVLEDLHWAEPSSVYLLDHLARSLRETETQALVLASLRPEHVASGTPLASMLLDAETARTDAPAGVVRRMLWGLDLPEVEELVMAHGGLATGQADAIARSLIASTSGNPLFIVEMLEQLAPGENELGVDPAGTGVPERIGELVAWKVARLGNTATGVLTMAAVMGVTFDVETLVTAAVAGEEAVLQALSAGLSARLLRETKRGSDHLGFTHELVRAAIYDSLSEPHRIRLHRRIGLAIEQGVAPEARIEELAYHFGEAVPVGERDRALAYARQAGDAARQSLAFAEASLHYEQALGYLAMAGSGEDTHQELSATTALRLSLGESLRLAGDSRHRSVLAEAASEARQLGDRVLLARVALAWNGIGQPTRAWDVDRDLAGLIEEAEAGLPTSHHELRARLIATHVAERLWDGDLAGTGNLARQAIDEARLSGSPAVMAQVLAGTHDALAGPDQLHYQQRSSVRLLDIGKQIDDPVASCWGHLFSMDTLVETGAPRAEAEAHLAQAERLAERLTGSGGSLAWEVAIRRAGLVLHHGELPAADTLIDTAHELAGRCGVPLVVADIVAASQRAMMHGVEGDLSPLAETAAIYAGVPGQHGWKAVEVMALDDLGRRAEAVRALELLMREGFADRPRNLTWLGNTGIVGWACGRIGEPDQAAIIVDVLEPYQGRLPWLNGVPTPPTDLVLGLAWSMLGKQDRSLASLAAASAACEQAGAALWLGQVYQAETRVAAGTARSGYFFEPSK
ncbi:MAG: ATP-binding protein [Acidimicrobiales bacterium]